MRSRIRAIGYDLDSPQSVEVARRNTATADLKLRKTEDLAAQMSNAEWINSIPGTDQQKSALLNCVGCHTLERVVRSTHDADEFLHVTLPRMQGYVNQSIPAAPAAAQRRAADGGARRPARAGLPRGGRLPQHASI